MKKITSTLFSMIAFNLFAQTIIPQVAELPVTGFQKIQNENPYMIVYQANDSNSTGWDPIQRYTNTTSNILRENRTSTWNGHSWDDVQLEQDSFILDAQSNVKTAYEYFMLQYPGLNYASKNRYYFSYDSNKKVSQVLVQSANPPTSKNYINTYKLFIYYDSTGKRTADTVQNYNPTSYRYTHYYYDNSGKVIGEYSLNDAGDSTGKNLYNYNGYGLINATSFYFDQDSFAWLPQNNDTFEYNPEGLISKHVSYGFYSINGSAFKHGPISNESYHYTSLGKLDEIIERSWNDTNWNNANKITFTYNSDKPTVGYQYLWLATNKTWDTKAANKYTFEPLSGINEVSFENTTVTMYPNPADQILSIQSGSTEGTLTLYNDKGQKLLQQLLTETSINTSMLPNGVYFIHLQTKDKMSTQKVLINH